jgi:hypothetical protein
MTPEPAAAQAHPAFFRKSRRIISSILDTRKILAKNRFKPSCAACYAKFEQLNGADTIDVSLRQMARMITP